MTWRARRQPERASLGTRVAGRRGTEVGAALRSARLLTMADALDVALGRCPERRYVEDHPESARLAREASKFCRVATPDPCCTPSRSRFRVFRVRSGARVDHGRRDPLVDLLGDYSAGLMGLGSPEVGDAVRAVIRPGVRVRRHE